MKQFRSLTCGASGEPSLCLLPAYLDKHPLPEELGSLSHADFVGHKSILRDDEHPGHYFTKNANVGLARTGIALIPGVYGLLINLLQAGGPEATL